MYQVIFLNNFHFQPFYLFVYQVHKIDPNLFEGYLLYYACKDGKLESVKFLLDNTDIDPNWHGGSCLLAARHKGHTEITNLLLQKLEEN